MFCLLLLVFFPGPVAHQNCEHYRTRIRHVQHLHVHSSNAMCIYERAYTNVHIQLHHLKSNRQSARTPYSWMHNCTTLQSSTHYLVVSLCNWHYLWTSTIWYAGYMASNICISDYKQKRWTNQPYLYVCGMYIQTLYGCNASLNAHSAENLQMFHCDRCINVLASQCIHCVTKYKWQLELHWYTGYASRI